MNKKLKDLPISNDCENCNGWGWLDSNVKKTCPECGGTGVQKQ